MKILVHVRVAGAGPVAWGTLGGIGQRPINFFRLRA